jgi:GGDEF domain-containing protein
MAELDVGDDLTSFFRRADERMYAAKQQRSREAVRAGT